jgi:capsid protein
MATSAPIELAPKDNSNLYGRRNTLIATATQTADRQRVLPMDVDIHRNVSTYGRRTLMSLGRWMFYNIPEIQGAILEQANLAVSTFIPQYAGANRAWGQQAESWLREWHKIMDIGGWPYDYETYVQFLVINPLVDGDIGTLLTQTDSGYPAIQTIPAHRIDALVNIVVGGDYDGMKIVDGTIVDDYGRAVAYRVKTQDGFDQNHFVDVPANDLFLTYSPLSPNQFRGFSALASSAFNLQDRDESRKFELLAQKAFSTKTVIETNESGEADAASDLLRSALTDSTTGAKLSLDSERLDGGTITYFKAGTNSKLDAFAWDRPSANVQEFQERTLRDAFRGSEWDVLFSIDPKNVGGASMRIVVEKINATLGKRRRLVEKACRRVDGWAISKAIKLGLLPNDVDWYKWEYQGPAEISADRKYDSEIDIEEISRGLGTQRAAIARRGGFYDDVRAQRKQEADDELSDASELATKYGITLVDAMNVLRPPARTTATQTTTNTTQSNSADPQDTPQ